MNNGPGLKIVALFWAILPSVLTLWIEVSAKGEATQIMLVFVFITAV